jgi:60 kDa SS-A/Ro ribonucleoprotein
MLVSDEPKGDMKMSKALRGYAAEQVVKATATPQMERTPGRTDEVQNNAGGFVFKVSDKDRLERFLILGVDGGTYYVSEQKLTEKSATFLKAFLAKDERAFVDTVVDVSTNNRAAKQSPAIFAIALALSEGQDKAYAREAVSKVVRTSTQLFEFAEYIKAFGGWGRSKRAAVAGWYEGKDAGSLAYQAVKYRQRNGWTHRDLLRLSHPKGVDQNVGNFILGKTPVAEATEPVLLDGFREMQSADSVDAVLRVLGLAQYKGLPWETIPTEFLKDAKVWKTLFYNGALGQTALIRNVTRFAKIGAFKDVKFAGDVATALSDAERIVKGRVHPIAYANAMGIYGEGQIGNSGSGWSGYGARTKDWDTNSKVLAGLEAGFYNSFQTIEPANKRTMISVDTSGSMTWGAPAGLVGMDYMGAAALVAMVTLRTEPYVEVNAYGTSMKALPLRENDSLPQIRAKLENARAGGTDCALPLVYARENGREFDTFVNLTDNETWAGRIKPSQALVQYRKSSGIDARMAVVAFAGEAFTIADPADRGMMDFVGFDSAGPRVLADFSAGRI